MATTQQQQQQRLHRTANNVIALGRVAKSSYCDHSGWASKQGSIIKSWKRRYFVLKGRELIYFAERSPSGKGIDEKGRLKVVGVEFTPEFRNGLLIKGELKNQTMKLQLETNDESLEWYTRIKDMLQNGGSSSSSAHGSGAGTGAARVTMQGWLYKEGQNFKTWKKRYMTLSDRTIKYHARAGEAPLGEAVVNDYNVNPAKPFALDVFSDNNRIFRIAADSFGDIEAWDQAIAKAIGKAPCFGDPYADAKTPFLGDTFAETTTCEGWLYKRGQRSTAWKRRFFMLSGFQLQYQESPGESPKGEGSVVDLQLGEDGSNLMEIQLDSGRVLTVSADTKEQLDIWIHAICELLDKDPATIDAIAPATRASTSGAGAGGNALRRGLSLGSRQSSSSNVVTASSSSGGEDESSSARKTGWLKKQGKHMKSWKRRFFVVDDRSVTYCEQLHETPKGSGVIQDVSVNPTFPNCLDIVLTTGRVLRVSAESPDEIRSWLQHIVDVLENSRDGDDDKASGDAGGRASSSSSGIGALGRQASFDIGGTGTAALEPGKGWLMKKGKNFKTWKRRYFVLDGQKLSYASNVGESPLGCGLVSYVTLGNARPFCIDVRFKNGRILNVAASNEAEMILWCKALQAALKAHHANANTDEDASAAEFDFDDNDDDESAVATDHRVRHSTSGIPTGRPSLGQQASSRKSLGQQPSVSRKSMLGRGSSLDSDESFDDSVPYMDLSRASLDESLPGCSGWLRKEGSTIKNWKLRYFTLNGTLLSYFKSDNGPLIKTLKVCHVLVMRTKKFCLEVTAECGRKLLIAADSSAEYDRWLAALHQAVSAGKAKKETSTRKIVRL